MSMKSGFSRIWGIRQRLISHDKGCLLLLELLKGDSHRIYTTIWGQPEVKVQVHRPLKVKRLIRFPER
jgi:hypothetical protein